MWRHLKSLQSDRKKTFRIVMAAIMLLSLGILGWFQFFVAAPVRSLQKKISELVDSDPEQALALYPELVALIEKQNMWKADQAKALLEWGQQLEFHKRHAEAIPVLERCLALCRDKPPGTSESGTLVEICRCNLVLKKITDEDLKNLAVAARVHPPIETNIDPNFWPTYDQILGRVLVAKGDYAGGIKHLQKSVDENKGYDYSYQESQSYVLDAYLKQGKYREANRQFIEYFGAVLDAKNNVYLPSFYMTSLKHAEDRDSEFRRKVVDLLSKKQFTALDNMTAKLLASKEVDANGDIAINKFDEAIDSLDDMDLDPVWKERIGLIEEWIKTSPACASAETALGRVLISFAWKARGGYWASEVTDTQWKVFGERLNQAKAVLDRVKERPPQWYSIMQRCALGLNYEAGPYDALVAEGQKHYPGYDRIPFNKCFRLLPRWSGKPGECASYIKAEADKRSGIAGDIFSARCLWYLCSYANENMIGQSNVSWPRVRAGMEAIVKQYPQSLEAKGALAVFAMEANDKETALKAFAK